MSIHKKYKISFTVTVLYDEDKVEIVNNLIRAYNPSNIDLEIVK